MRVAMIAPPWYPVPAEGYGGTERVIALLARGLRAGGHHVTLYGREGSTEGDVVRARAPAAWSEQFGSWVHHHTYAARVYRELRREPFDLVHDHTGAEGLLLAAFAAVPAPVVGTFHGPVGAAEAGFLAEIDEQVALVAVSEAQRAGADAAGVHWAGVIHNGLDERELLPALPDKDGYLVQLARIDESKGQHLAIEVARRAGLPLVLAGKVDDLPECRGYFRSRIEPHLGTGVSWLPEVRGLEKAMLLARAGAAIFPLQWDEPFGLALAEAMANGTPVVALNRGAAGELIEDAVTGLVVQDVDDMVRAISDVRSLDPQRCARRARDRFSAHRMVDAYLRIYRAVRARA
jgi:glycosyltransferase involved in cell wall biosynthesis